MNEIRNEGESRKRILLLIPHLGGGGAEKVVEQLARGLSAERYEVHLGLVTALSVGASVIPESVQVHALGSGRVRWSGLKILRLVRRTRPQLILSGIAHLNFLILMLRPLFPRGTRVLVRQNTTVSAVLNEGRVPFYTRALYRLLYKRADRVLCQTEAMAKDLKKALRVPAEKIAILLNPVEIPARVDLSAARDDGGIQLLAVGRLAHEKGFDLLLKAFAFLLPEFPELRLRIVGVGPEEKPLRALCGVLNLEGCVEFAGFMKEPLRGAQIFVLSSRFEGMPNALLEAAACGLPIVATPCSEGVVRLLRNQPGVWLAEAISTDALSNAMRSALVALDPGERFVHGFVEPFRFERAISAYERVIEEELAR